MDNNYRNIHSKHIITTSDVFFLFLLFQISSPNLQLRHIIHHVLFLYAIKYRIRFLFRINFFFAICYMARKLYWMLSTVGDLYIQELSYTSSFHFLILFSRHISESPADSFSYIVENFVFCAMKLKCNDGKNNKNQNNRAGKNDNSNNNTDMCMSPNKLPNAQSTRMKTICIHCTYISLLYAGIQIIGACM